MQPDTQQVTTFTANEAGNFKYFCMVRGHLWLGMIGDLTVQNVKNPSSSSTSTSGGSGV
jgi:plastocyanin